jgi:FAD/FMN-containing dehydrogenase
MKRRTFCASAISALAATSIPFERLIAANDSGASVPAMGSAGNSIALSSKDIAEFRASLRGQLLVPGQEGYDSARRLWNGAFNRKPALIARCAGAADVTQAINFARSQNLLVAVRGGGHSLSGLSACDGGLMIDLSPMKSVRVDPIAKIARVEPGVLLGQFDRESQAYGLATTAGTVSHTGVAGLTLGGGFGRLARRFGLACDNLIAADVVTADGRFVKTSTKDNPELLWGLRGGGGNLGVVTSFEYQLHRVDPMMYGGTLVFALDRPRELLRSYADFVARASDELYCEVTLVPAPEGKGAFAVHACHSGTRAAAEKELAPLRKLGRVVQDGVGPNTYVAIQSAADADFPVGRGYYVKSGFVNDISGKLVDAMVDYAEATPTTSGVMMIAQHGGAISRVSPGATAYWHRQALHSVLIVSFWDRPEGKEPNAQWVRSGWAKLAPLTEGVYVNLLTQDEMERRIRSTYGDNYSRLVALKKQYDPTNLFRLNANIKPG